MLQGQTNTSLITTDQTFQAQLNTNNQQIQILQAFQAEQDTKTTWRHQRSLVKCLGSKIVPSTRWFN